MIKQIISAVPTAELNRRAKIAKPVWQFKEGLCFLENNTGDLQSHFTLSPRAGEPARGLQLLAEIETFHVPGIADRGTRFEPTIGQVLAQIPNELLDIATAFDTRKIDGYEQAHHRAKTRLYRPAEHLIEIVQMPAGEADMAIRVAWIGLQLPCDPVLGENGPEKGIITGKTTPSRSGFSVRFQDALIALEHGSRHKALDYFKRHPLKDGKYFCFAEKEGRIIRGVKRQVIEHWDTQEVPGGSSR